MRPAAARRYAADGVLTAQSRHVLNGPIAGRIGPHAIKARLGHRILRVISIGRDSPRPSYITIDIKLAKNLTLTRRAVLIRVRSGAAEVAPGHLMTNRLSCCGTGPAERLPR